MRSTEPVEATVYIQVEPVWGQRWAGDDEVPLRGAKIVRATQQRPSKPIPGAVLLTLKVQVPAGAFYPLRPSATVVIPDGFAELTPPVEVTVEAPPGPEPRDEEP